MHTARSLLYPGGLPRQKPPWQKPPEQEVTSYRDPCGQTNASENITLPQTSFAGGNKYVFDN